MLGEHGQVGSSVGWGKAAGVKGEGCSFAGVH